MHKKSLRLTRANAGLVVVDVQERLLPAIFEQQRVVQNTVRLIQGLCAINGDTFATEQYRKGLGPTAPEVAAAIPGFAPMEKLAFSACGAAGFIPALKKKKVSEAILCGIEAHVCVSQTCLDLLDKRLRVFVVADAVSSRTPENYQYGLDRMRAAGAVIVSTEMVLFELLEQVGTAEFKQVLTLVKYGSSVEPLHADVLVADHTAGVVRLQGEGALTQLVLEILAGLCPGRLVVLEELLAINQHRDHVALHDDLLRPPFAVHRRGARDVDQRVEATGLDPVAVGVIDLALEAAFRPALGLVFRMEVNAAIGVGFGHHIDLEVEVLEGFLVADIEQVAGLAARYKGPILDLPNVLVHLGWFSAVEGLAIEERREAGLQIVRQQRGSCVKECGGRHNRQKNSFHDRGH